MKNYSKCIGKKITIKDCIEDWNQHTRQFEYKPLTGILTAYRHWTDDYGAITYWATINGREYNVTNKKFEIVD